MPRPIGDTPALPPPPTPPVELRTEATATIIDVSKDYAIDVSGSSRFVALWFSPPPLSPGFSPAERRAVDTFTRAGLPLEDAITLATRGVSADEATEMLNLALMTPSIERYGPALVTLRVLNEARAFGGVTPARVRELMRAHDGMAVMRPDGYLAWATTGRPIEQRKDLQIGGTFHLASGILRETNEDYSRGRIVAELGLQKGFVGQLLDGAESAVMDVVFEIAKAIEDPAGAAERAVHGFGNLPNTIATLVRKSPELYDQYRNMSEGDRVRVISKAVTSLLLAAFGGGAVSSGAAVTKASFGGARLMKLAGAPGMVLTGIDGAAVAVGLGHMGVGAGISVAAMASMPDGDTASGTTATLEPRARYKRYEQVRRAFGDANDRQAYPNVDDLEVGLDIVEGFRSKDMLPDVHARIAERLLLDVDTADAASLEKMAKLSRRLGEHRPAVAQRITDRIEDRIRTLDDLQEVARWAKTKSELPDEIARLDTALASRFRSEATRLDDIPADTRLTTRIHQLRRFADEAGIDVHDRQRPEAAQEARW